MSTSTKASLDYALILGQGRSGTNYLLGLLNQSPLTHCRNEADQLEASALRELAPYRFFVDDPEDPTGLASCWDKAIHEAALTFGPRDHEVAHPKVWLFPGARRPGYFYIRQRYRIVHKVGRKGPAMNGREIRFPRWMTTPGRLERAFHVFKLNAACGLAGWMFDHRPEARALHIVRHPGGFTKSWLRRWVANQGAEKTEEGNKARLRTLAEREPEWAARLGDIDGLSMIEAELWFWRWCNERIAADGEGSDRYHRVIFEELAADPTGVTEGVYRFCDLPWSPQVSARVARISQRAPSIASAWKDELDAPVVETIERVLHGSPLTGFWETS